MSSVNKEIYNVLMQLQSQNEAERLISVFRSGGAAVRVHRITSEADLNESLEDSNWDLLVVDNQHPEVSLSYSLGVIKKQQRDLPIILLSEDVDHEVRDQAFNLGIKDVIEREDNIHFIHASLREMQGVRRRNYSQRLQHDYQELKKRADLLLDQSDDAIAYVSDGILIKVNEKFAETFAYEADDLDFLSIIDLVSAQDQEEFKDFFRHFSSGRSKANELSFTGLTKDKQPVAATITLEHSMIDGEQCTQVIIPSGEPVCAEESTKDLATGLYNRYFLENEMASLVSQIGHGIPSASLVLLRIDSSNRVLNDIKFSGLDVLCLNLAKLAEQVFTPHLVARLSTDTIALLTCKSAEKTLPFAETAVKQVEDYINEVGNRTYQFTCTASVMQLSNKDTKTLLDHAFIGVGYIRDQHEKSHAAIFAPTADTVHASANELNVDEAIEMGFFSLMYQPLLSLQGGETQHYEAVLAFNGDAESYPEALIHSSQEAKLDRWIIVEGVKALAEKRQAGAEANDGEEPDIRLMINVTRNALFDDGLAAWLSVALKAVSLKPEHIALQFRDVDVKNNLKSAIQNITALRESQFTVSVREFGQDEEPFKLLRHVNVDLVKFTAECTSDNKMLKQLIADAEEHSLKTIVPDVDNASMLASMWQLGAHYIEGAYLQGPTETMDYEFAEF